MDKIISALDAVSCIPNGATIMVGGFMAVGTPEILIDALVYCKTGDLTVICNDAGVPEKGVGKLISKHLVKKLIASHVGLNPEVGIQMSKGELECVLIPQGTLAERIRSGGAGLGGFFTPTGVGTLVAEGKESRCIEGKEYLLEYPIRADFALVRASVTDKFGNSTYHNATRNFNPLIATAADHVIVATEKLVKTGDINPNHVVTSGIFVDAIVLGEPKC